MVADNLNLTTNTIFASDGTLLDVVEDWDSAFAGALQHK